MAEISFDEYISLLTDDYQIKAVENSVDELLFVDWMDECYVRKLSISSARKYLEDKARNQFVPWK